MSLVERLLILYPWVVGCIHITILYAYMVIVSNLTCHCDDNVV